MNYNQKVLTMESYLIPKPKGSTTDGFTEEFAKDVYDKCPIFQHRGFKEFYTTTKGIIEGEERLEYVVREDGKVLASMAIIKENDMHVGECLSVLLALSTDKGLLKGGYKELIKVAKQLGVPYVAYTQDVTEEHNAQGGDKMISHIPHSFTYRLVYRKVK